MAEFLEFYERDEFTSHSYTTSRSGRAIGVALLGFVDLSLTQYFQWKTLDTLMSLSVPNIKIKSIMVKDKKYELMLISTSDKVNLYRIDEPNPGMSHIRVKKLSSISVPRSLSSETRETQIEMVFDYVEDRKISHIIVANGNLIACH